SPIHTSFHTISALPPNERFAVNDRQRNRWRRGRPKFGSGKTGENIDPALLHLLAEPAGEFVQRDNVIAVVLKRCGNNRETELAVPGQEQNVVILDRVLNRGTFLFPVGHQLADTPGIHHRTGDDVSTDFLPFFQNSDGNVFIQLSQVISSGKSGRTATDNQNIDVQTLVFGHTSRIASRPQKDTKGT